MSTELRRVAHKLEEAGYAHTSYDRLGLSLDDKLVDEICTAAATNPFGQTVKKLTDHVEKPDLIMVQDEMSLELGRRLIEPVIEVCFGNNRQTEWKTYTLNYYPSSRSALGPHQDTVGKSVVIVTASGVRDFNIHSQPRWEGQRTPIIETFRVDTGSIILLDAQARPAHSVACIEGPSVSVVSGVRDMLRPEESYQINQLT